jgi:1,3-propanediol dehydrogenase
VVGYNFSQASRRYRKVAQALGLDPPEQDEYLLPVLLEGLRRLRREAGVTNTLAALGVSRGDLRQLAEKAGADACLVTNPRPAGTRDLEAIYEQAL